MKRKVKIAITGAAGRIGYALLFRLLSGHVFGQEVKIDLNLLDLPSSESALQGIKMELEDCAFPLLNHVLCTSDVDLAMKEVNWVVLIGALPRAKGMERGELLKENGTIFAKQGRAINENAASNVQVLVVGNPCNTNAYIVMCRAQDIPKERFFAMMALDELRAKAQLAQKARVSVSDVHNMIIWGNHSSTQFPDFYHARVKDQFVVDAISDYNWLKSEFTKSVQERGGEIIRMLGSSSAASAANAILSTLSHIEQGTEEVSFSIAKCSRGEYGVDEGLVFSFPCQVNEGRVKVVNRIEHSDFAKGKLKETLEELRMERAIVKNMGLV